MKYLGQTINDNDLINKKYLEDQLKDILEAITALERAISQKSQVQIVNWEEND